MLPHGPLHDGVHCPHCPVSFQKWYPLREPDLWHTRLSEDTSYPDQSVASHLDIALTGLSVLRSLAKYSKCWCWEYLDMRWLPIISQSVSSQESRLFLVAYMVLTQAIKSLNRTKYWYLEQEGILQPSGVKFSTKIYSPFLRRKLEHWQPWIFNRCSALQRNDYQSPQSHDRNPYNTVDFCTCACCVGSTSLRPPTDTEVNIKVVTLDTLLEKSLPSPTTTAILTSMSESWGGTIMVTLNPQRGTSVTEACSWEGKWTFK